MTKRDKVTLSYSKCLGFHAPPIWRYPQDHTIAIEQANEAKYFHRFDKVSGA